MAVFIVLALTIPDKCGWTRSDHERTMLFSLRARPLPEPASNVQTHFPDTFRCGFFALTVASCDGGGGGRTIGDPPGGISAFVEVVLTAPAEAEAVILLANARSDTPDANSDNNADSSSVTVIYAIDILVEGTSEGSGSVGIEWKFNAQWSLTAEWERYQLNEWLDVPTVGIRFTF